MNDFENDLLNCNFICTKAQNDVYAQHLYAALCNNDFVKNEVVPILKDQFWNCSWRYAGEIVANLRGHGDYLSWYCSGIPADWDATSASKEYVPEGTVTDEIRKDLHTLGWVIV